MLTTADLPRLWGGGLRFGVLIRWGVLPSCNRRSRWRRNQFAFRIQDLPTWLASIVSEHGVPLFSRLESKDVVPVGDFAEGKVGLLRILVPRKEHSFQWE